ncbi:MAG: hypothetical protein OEY36_06585 [Gammaproteobacteria bacterium]|nr:hypothetical protein [Gammaproteobacteria bacterium]
MLEKIKQIPLVVVLTLGSLISQVSAEEQYVESRRFGYMGLRVASTVQSVQGTEHFGGMMKAEFGIKPFRSSGLSVRAGSDLMDLYSTSTGGSDAEISLYYGAGYTYLFGDPNHGRWYAQYNYDDYLGDEGVICNYICGYKTSYGVGYVGRTWHFVYEQEQVVNDFGGKNGFSYSIMSGGFILKYSNLGNYASSSIGFLLNY